MSIVLLRMALIGPWGVCSSALVLGFSLVLAHLSCWVEGKPSFEATFVGPLGWLSLAKSKPSLGQ